MPPYIPDTITNAMRSSHMLGIFLRIDTTPPLHVWFGVNDIPAGFDSIDPDGTVYMGGGRLIDVPSLEVLMNATSDSVIFTMSGIDPKTAGQMLDSIPPLRGATVQLGITTLDQYYQPMSAIIPIWTGTASHTIEESPAVYGDKSPTMTLALAVVAGDKGRSRPSRSMWSAAHQGIPENNSVNYVAKTKAQIAAEKAANEAAGQPNKKIDWWVVDANGNPVVDTTIYPDNPPAGYNDLGQPVYRDRACDGTARLARGVVPVWPRYN